MEKPKARAIVRPIPLVYTSFVGKAPAIAKTRTAKTSAEDSGHESGSFSMVQDSKDPRKADRVGDGSGL